MADSPATTATRSSYDEALARVMGLANFERSLQSPSHSSFHLERMGLLMERLGNPHLAVPAIHVAGTKGKGSTAAMITSMLTAQGYTVGLYTSPHLHRTVERIRVGLDPIAPDDFAALVDDMWPTVKAVGTGPYSEVTFFEMLTAMAFVWFARLGADFQVVEVGLGGRLDATNVVAPKVCAITHISLDHVKTLGDTVELIAGEKAGIIKQGVPVVVAPQSEEALEVFRQVAAQRSATLIHVGAEKAWRVLNSDLSGQGFELEGRGGVRTLRVPLLGAHQMENAATAVTVVETLSDNAWDISDDAISQGLETVDWPARMQTFSRDGRLVVADGAHNAHSARRLVEALRGHFDCSRVVLVFGALRGHNHADMLRELGTLSPLVLAVRSRDPRALESSVIGEAARNIGLPVALESDSVGLAARRAMELAGEGGLVVAAGSLTVAAEAIEEMEGIEPELYPYLERAASV